MFSGHFGVAFGSKRAAPTVSLATAILAAQWLDTLWPFFLLLGLEHVRIDPGNTRLTALDFTDYPWSHSALMAVVSEGCEMPQRQAARVKLSSSHSARK